jgi:hypothetical protein
MQDGVVAAGISVARRRTKLRTVGHVLAELGRQYRRADEGELDWADAAAAARILREIRHKCFSAATL